MKLSVFVSALLASQLAMAVNIRVIGNGGGEDEMQLLTEVSKVKERLRLCGRPENYCGLGETDRQAIRELLKQIESQDLVLAGDEPEFDATGANISEAVFLALVTHPELKGRVPEKNWKALANLTMTQVQSQSYPLAHLNQKIVTVSVPMRSLRLMIEKGSELRDVSDLVSEVVKCAGSSAAAKLIALTKEPREQLQGFASELQWSCGEIVKVSDLQGRYDKEAGWRFQSFATRVLPSSTSICASSLVDPHN